MQKLILLAIFYATPAFGLTANRVWAEFLPSTTRIWVNYTIPEVKQWREAYIDFRPQEKAAASKAFWDLVRGADFYIDDVGQMRFPEPKLNQADPW